MFEKEEKLYVDPDTGETRWITTKKGIIRERPSRTPAYDKLKPQIKAKQRAISKKKWEQRKKTFNKTAKTVNNALDWLEGTGKYGKKKTSYTPRKTPKKQYVVKGGVAYPVYKPRKPRTKPKKKKQNDPFDFNIKW